MAFQPVTDTVQLCWRFRLFGQQIQCCIGLVTPDPITETTLDNLTASAVNSYAAVIAPTMPQAVSLNSIYARSLETEVAPQSEDTNGGVPIPGTVVDTIEDAQAAFILAFGSGQTGRSTRGRIYIPGVSATATTNGEVTVPTATAVATAWVDHIEDIEGLTYTHSVVSRVTNGVRRPTGVTFTVNNYAVRALIGSQRNRRPGIGQ